MQRTGGAGVQGNPPYPRPDASGYRERPSGGNGPRHEGRPQYVLRAAPNGKTPQIICLHMGVALTGGARLRGKILDFRGLGGPERLGARSKRWGASPPTFLRGFPAARGRPDRENPGFTLSIWAPLLPSSSRNWKSALD